MRRSVIADVTVGLLFHAMLVLSLYLLFVGHNQPGGGFSGGLVAGAALSLRYVVGGIDEVRAAIRVPGWIVMGLGLCTAAITALTPVLLGHEVLNHGTLSADLPLLGPIKATSALPFDIGVYLVVVGVALMAFEAFGDEADPEPGGAVAEPDQDASEPR